ncbi:outer membrane protein assembly factor BamD [Suttonella ornithocola]|uniref:Outer membrane protein assembly factor BamD n=1 Tax=Suttonella ornithocola TaxID=279832 RepID=A0A380MNI3_9GAMM|nr:outer membrane protein assembly factor BamD [Suttonella ornithocola]SUO94189.1 Competence lipoprotein ComL precursor [Suttonella ornithocola]
MQLRHTFIAVAIATSLIGCSSLKQDHTIDWSAAQLYQAGKSELQDGSYSSAEDYYTKLLSRFPYGRLAQQSLLDLAYVQYKSGESEKAIATLEDFIRTYPQHPYIDYALYMKGVVEYERNVSFFNRLVPTNLSQTDPEALKKAFNDFDYLVTHYPKSEYSEDAKYRMVYIRNLLGEHYLEVADYYLRRGAYVSAVNRAKQVLQEYEQTPSAPYALAILSRAYKEMGEQTLSADAQRVLQQNFPEKLQNQEIQQILTGKIHRQRSFLERVMAEPKI